MNQIQILSGTWRLACDAENKGRADAWYVSDDRAEALEAPVPGILQQVFPEHHGLVWYWHRFVPERSGRAGDLYRLRFAYVDYYAEFWLNGVSIGRHEGDELPFEFDVTDALVFGQENLLAIRLLNPTDERIDGFLLSETPCRNKIPRNVSPGCSFNYGGILYRVELHAVPKVRIAEIHTRPYVETGEVRVVVHVENVTPSILKADVSVRVLSGNPGRVHASARTSVTLAPGESLHEIRLTVPQARLWSLDEPVLYTAQADLDVQGEDPAASDTSSVRFGFRELRVENGYFRLNGKRIFLRSTHTGNHFPVGTAFPSESRMMLQDLVFAKASGFNMVRFIWGTAFPEQLDFCDEVGLLVYEESHGSSLESDRIAERFEAPILGVIRRDRNHPCVVVWGLLNEKFDGPVFRHAQGMLPAIRAVDETRLVFIDSGRWDLQRDTGSVSNPGTVDWQCVWGEEAPDAAPLPYTPPQSWDWGYPAGFYNGMGDIHIYPVEPRTDEVDRLIRTLGRDTKPVYISECGVGSQTDVLRYTRWYEQIGAREDLHDADIFRRILGLLMEDWATFGLGAVYPFPEDLFRDSYRLHAQERARVFDSVRSNPKFCGYNVTGMLDHGYCGEGLWTFFREWKPGMADVLQDGWAPLRWCLFVEPRHDFADRPLRIEAVLATEDVLPPGEYPVAFKISGPDGVVWETERTLRIPEPAEGAERLLAVPVLDERIVLSGSEGKHVFSASLLRGGAPSCGRLEFQRTASPLLSLPGLDLALHGVGEGVTAWLDGHGVARHALDLSRRSPPGLVLVGGEPDTEGAGLDFDALWSYVSEGGTVVFASPSALMKEAESTGRLPFEQKGECRKVLNWLYHMDCIGRSHPYLEGLQGKGMLDWSFYGQTIPDHVLGGIRPPDEIAAVALATGFPVPSGYESGILLGAYRHGAGRIVLNTFRLLDNLKKNPAADRMLLNILATERDHLEGKRGV
jgi:hypothetical protein